MGYLELGVTSNYQDDGYKYNGEQTLPGQVIEEDACQGESTGRTTPRSPSVKSNYSGSQSSKDSTAQRPSSVAKTAEAFGEGAKPKAPCVDEVGRIVDRLRESPETALPLLRELCRTSAGQRTVARVGGIEEVMACVRRLQENRDTPRLVLAMEALESMVMLNPEFQGRATEAGAPEVLVGVMTNTETANLASTACSAAAVLSYRSAISCDNLSKVGAGEALVNLLGVFPDDANVQRSACGALYRLASEDGPSRRRVCACEGIREALERAAQAGYSDDAHWFRMKAWELWPDKGFADITQAPVASP